MPPPKEEGDPYSEHTDELEVTKSECRLGAFIDKNKGSNWSITAESGHQ